MQTSLDRPAGGTQGELLRELLRHKSGLTIDALSEKQGISRNAVRQHLLGLERDGLVSRGEALPSGGRPEHVYIITPKGLELFPRQYSWMSELLLQAMHKSIGDDKLEQNLAAMGEDVGASLKNQLPGATGSAVQIGALAGAMTGLGYDAETDFENGETVIRAHNCVFHKLARQYPQICKFDTSLLSAATGSAVEQTSCMARGDNACCFRFGKPKK